MQAAVDAAGRAGHGAVAYLPFGRYRITRTLNVTGRGFRIEGGGSGFRTCLAWAGPAGGVIVHVQNARDVTIENLAVGHGALSPRPTVADILYTSGTTASILTLDYVFVYGLHRKEPDRGGLVVDGLSKDDSLLIEHLEGNIRVQNSSAARILTRTSYEGTLRITGPPTRCGTPVS